MEHPGRGAPYSIRALAEASGVPASTIGHLVSGRKNACDMGQAHALAEALGVGVLVLFAPPPSPEANEPTPGMNQSNINSREDEPCEHARAHQTV
ncbi:helix-turn-helix domain-containing protein [Streptomyces sp. NBC_00842]|uniref:helix-turn-helix domain-containing protein n=1 Tax=Streptomyces sp. NBC_00842 TaxID=2975848 RepID=UPI003866676D